MGSLRQVSSMDLVTDNVFTLLVGAAAVISLVIAITLALTGNNKKEKKLERRKTSHVTEVLQVDMVDRRIRTTSLDHSVEMEDIRDSSEGRADAVLRPIAGLSVTKIE